MGIETIIGVEKMYKYKKELNVAVNTVKKAGELIIEMSKEKKDIIVSNKAVNDFVTNVDKASEDLIKEELSSAFPDYDILAEETGGMVKGSKPKWIIDPIDGTLNFMRGIPIFAISLGLEIDNEIVVGIVFNVPMNEMFIAIKEKGAYLNGEKINVSKTSVIDRIVVGTGFPFRKEADFDSYMSLFQELAQHTSGLRRPGSASIDLCWMACARYDAFFEFGLHPWDVSAGALIIKEAGGIVTDAKGGDNFIYGGNILAANNQIVYDFMLNYIKKYYYKD